MDLSELKSRIQLCSGFIDFTFCRFFRAGAGSSGSMRMKMADCFCARVLRLVKADLKSLGSEKDGPRGTKR